MEADTVVLMITIVGLHLTTMGLLMGQISGLRHRLDDLAERVARIEGYLMMSGGFMLQVPGPPPASEASPEDPAPDSRQAS